MRLLIVGAGGIGGYFGAQFVRGGHEVTFLARGAHLAALRTHGLTVESALAPAQIPVHATDDLQSVGTVDAIVVCTKLADLESVARQLAPVAGNALIVSTQNGVDAPEILAQHLTRARIAPGVAHIAAVIKAPGVIAHNGNFARLRVGTRAGGPSVVEVDALVDAGKASGIDIARSDDIDRTLWEKFVFLVALSGVTCLARQPVGVVRSHPQLRATLLASMQETAAVAAARSVQLEPEYAAAQMGFIDGLPETMRSSMLNDLTAGRKLEAPWLAGAVVRMGEAAQVATPVNRTLYAALEPYLLGSPN
jgi:2-dehydropantoate 2-reductase